MSIPSSGAVYKTTFWIEASKAKVALSGSGWKSTIDMTKLYKYTGPDAVLEAVAGSAPGVTIRSAEGLAAWSQQQDEWDEDCLVATFVVLENGDLRLAPRRSEHVACAGGQAVLAAGELTIGAASSLEIVGVSNLSTGYCPEPSCWHAIQASLAQLDIPFPSTLTESYTFRKCLECGERNLVKDDWYVCAVCDADLPRDWNF